MCPDVRAAHRRVRRGAARRRRRRSSSRRACRVREPVVQEARRARAARRRRHRAVRARGAGAGRGRHRHQRQEHGDDAGRRRSRTPAGARRSPAAISASRRSTCSSGRLPELYVLELSSFQLETTLVAAARRRDRAQRDAGSPRSLRDAGGLRRGEGAHLRRLRRRGRQSRRRRWCARCRAPDSACCRFSLRSPRCGLTRCADQRRAARAPARRAAAAAVASCDCRAGTTPPTRSPRSRCARRLHWPMRRCSQRCGFRRPAAPRAVGRRHATACTTSTTRRAPTSARPSRRSTGMSGPLVLIAGGDGKGQDFAPLARGLPRQGAARRADRPRRARASRPRSQASARPSSPLDMARGGARRARGRAARRHGAAVAGLREPRHVPRLRAPRRRVRRRGQEPRAMSAAHHGLRALLGPSAPAGRSIRGSSAPVLALLLIGLVMVASASIGIAEQRDSATPFYYLAAAGRCSWLLGLVAALVGVDRADAALGAAFDLAAGRRVRAAGRWCSCRVSVTRSTAAAAGSASAS